MRACIQFDEHAGCASGVRPCMSHPLLNVVNEAGGRRRTTEKRQSLNFATHRRKRSETSTRRSSYSDGQGSRLVRHPPRPAHGASAMQRTRLLYEHRANVCAGLTLNLRGTYPARPSTAVCRRRLYERALALITGTCPQRLRGRVRGRVARAAAGADRHAAE
ncbi:hypothetical protein OH77DRAFT_1108341 [Trametes cingulata]|nr:hypothetical protein OH77DRAFT_1108341 [Trametes cingulata]